LINPTIDSRPKRPLLHKQIAHHNGPSWNALEVFKMPMKRIDMLRLKQILRLGLQEKRSQREIADAVGAGKSTVQEILATAQKSSLTWQTVRDLREHQLIELIYPVKTGAEPQPAPNWKEVKLELAKKGVTLTLLWEEYRENNPDPLSYSRFCFHYREWEKNSRLIMRQKHKAGEKLFLDFAGLTVPFFDLASNKIEEAQIFVAVMGASSKTFALAVADQSVASWTHCNVKALEFFGGVPEILIPDNLKAAVTTPSKYEPKIHSTYLDFAEHYQTTIIPARVRKPRDKAKVEVGVQVVERWILARLRKMTFGSVSEINSAIRPLLDQLNNKRMRHLEASRNELFERIDAKELRPLPPRPFELISRKKAKVNIDYHVELCRTFYSVPYRFVGKQVEIRFSRQLVEIIYDEDVIAVHQRITLAGGRRTQPEHMPSHHRAQAEWTPQRLLKWADSAGGPKTKELCESIMARGRHPELGFRSCRGLIRLAEKYGKDELEKACSEVLLRKKQSTSEVEKLLKSKQASTAPESKVTTHENIRGPSYYH
jgi:transposase